MKNLMLAAIMILMSVSLSFADSEGSNCESESVRVVKEIR